MMLTLKKPINNSSSKLSIPTPPDICLFQKKNKRHSPRFKNGGSTAASPVTCSSVKTFPNVVLLVIFQDGDGGHDGNLPAVPYRGCGSRTAGERQWESEWHHGGDAQRLLARIHVGSPFDSRSQPHPKEESTNVCPSAESGNNSTVRGTLSDFPCLSCLQYSTSLLYVIMFARLYSCLPVFTVVCLSVHLSGCLYTCVPD